MEFKGMALYNIDEIGSALEEYRTSINEVKAIIREKVKQAELDWKPSRWQKLWGVKTLKQYWSKTLCFQGYWEFIYDNHLISFDDTDLQKLVWVEGRNFHMYLNSWLSEYNEIKNLYNGGKECYLNQNQAAFINKFKKKELYNEL